MDTDNHVVKVAGEAGWRGTMGEKWGTSVIMSTTTKKCVLPTEICNSLVEKSKGEDVAQNWD